MIGIEIIGKEYGRLKILQIIRGNNKIARKAVCICSCGKITQPKLSNVLHGVTVSCGCYRNQETSKRSKTHGKTRTRIYRIYQNMLNRCANPKTIGWMNYGGRGIAVCDRWKKFENFYADMGDCLPKQSLNRIDNEGGYCPKNCEWTTHKKQMRNTRMNHFIEFRGERLCLLDWAKKMGIKRTTLRNRLKFGWSIERALLTKVN